MDSILVILLIVATVKFIVFGILLFVVFRDDIREYFSGKKPTEGKAPVCVYCESKWTVPIDEGQTRWENNDLLLVTTYECQHCHLPFWHVERVSTVSLRR